MTKHTPGPWEIKANDKLYTGGAYEIEEPFRHIPDNELDNDVYWEVILDNASLIAAAPDLLAACEEWLRVESEGGNLYMLYDQIKAAINKAGGKS